MPLFSSFELLPTTRHAYQRTPGSAPDSERKKSLRAYIPTFFTIFLLIAPHPSIFKVLVSYHLILQDSPKTFLFHLSVVYSLYFLIFTCLIIVLARDPGPVDPILAQKEEDSRYGGAAQSDTDDEDDDENLTLAEALMRGSRSEETKEVWRTEKRWCKKCWHPKPERCHHCNECNRCVLKMDHHCPWLANKCIGHRTYPAFVHLLLCVTLLSFYCAVVAISPVKYYLSSTTMIREDDHTPYHTLLIALLGGVFTLMIGSFWIYHVYLLSTNQTTLENITPFMLLRYVPPLPSLQEPSTLTTASSIAAPDGGLAEPPYVPNRASPSKSPNYSPSPMSAGSPNPLSPSASPSPTRLLEHELSRDQRRLVRRAHGKIKLYDVGWRQNWEQAVGGHRIDRDKQFRWKWWIRLILTGGSGSGDGYSFPFNPLAEKRLNRLAADMARAA